MPIRFAKTIRFYLAIAAALALAVPQGMDASIPSPSVPAAPRAASSVFTVTQAEASAPVTVALAERVPVTTELHVTCEELLTQKQLGLQAISAVNLHQPAACFHLEVSRHGSAIGALKVAPLGTQRVSVVVVPHASISAVSLHPYAPFERQTPVLLGMAVSEPQVSSTIHTIRQATVAVPEVAVQAPGPEELQVFRC